MIIDKQQRSHLKRQQYLLRFFVLCIIFLSAWLSTRYEMVTDWSSSGRNTLSEASKQVLNAIEQPVHMTAYATGNEQLRIAISELIARYQRHKADIQLAFVNPELEPDVSRELSITTDGELLIEINKRTERVQVLNETNITNALQRLARAGENWLAFVEGHGERKPRGVANHDLQNWSNHLEQRGYRIQELNLINTPAIPRNIKVLVIASPAVAMLPGEIDIINRYLDQGGNILMLVDPDENEQPLQPITERMGIEFLPGVIVDPTTQLFGIQDPRFTLVNEYGQHPITRNFQLMTLFPQAIGLEQNPSSDWQTDHFLVSADRAWSETGPLQSKVSFQADQDIPGPLSVGLALTRDLSLREGAQENAAPEDTASQSQQRIVVVGDGDFLANAYLGNGGNLDLGLHIINWLSADDDLISIPASIRTDNSLEFSPAWQAVIGFGFLVGIPLLLAATGFGIWWQRRKR